MSEGPADTPAARLAHLDELAELLWPGAERSRTRGGGDDLLIAPSAGRPRLLVPAGNRRAAARALRSHGAAPSSAQRVQRAVLGGVVGAGLGRWLLRDRLAVGANHRTIEDHLGQVLGQSIFAAMTITPPRANRKPVLHLMDSAGRTVGYAKIGISELTSQLVRHEAEVLATLALPDVLGAPTDRPMRVPAVLHHGPWRGLEILVLSPLPTDEATPARGARLTPAMTALAAATQLCPPNPAGYGDDLLGRAAAVPVPDTADGRTAFEAWLAAVRRLVSTGALDRLALGAWHGDWTPWNCGIAGGDVIVWDWERAGGPVPRGFDQLHYELQYRLIVDHIPHPAAARECLATAARTLAPWGIEPADATMTAAVYLAELALRYLDDNQRAWGGPGGRVETWLVPALTDYLQTTNA